jgi:hypothetical protein
MQDESGDAMRRPFEHLASDWIEFGLKAWGDARDSLVEQLFLFAYGRTDHAGAPLHIEFDVAREAAQSEARAELEGAVERGGLVGAFVRVVLCIAQPAGHVDERGFAALKEVGAMIPGEARPSFPGFKEVVRRQALTLQLDKQRAIAALPRIVPGDDDRRRLLDGLRHLLSFRPTLSDGQRRRLSQVETLLAVQGSRPSHRERVASEE